jgi:hypothetical protein
MFQESFYAAHAQWKHEALASDIRRARQVRAVRAAAHASRRRRGTPAGPRSPGLAVTWALVSKGFGRLPGLSLRGAGDGGGRVGNA